MPSHSTPSNSFFAYQQSLLTQEMEYIRAQIAQSDTLSFQGLRTMNRPEV